MLSVSGVPAGANSFTGNFGQPTKDVVFFKSGEASFAVSSIEEAGGKFKAAPLKTITLPQPARQLVVADGAKSRLLGIFRTNEPAQLLDFDGITRRSSCRLWLAQQTRC